MSTPVITSEFTHRNVHTNITQFYEINTYDTYTFAAMNRFHIAVLWAMTPCCNVAGGYQSLGGHMAEKPSDPITGIS
jgi:hypothetical protein